MRFHILAFAFAVLAILFGVLAVNQYIDSQLPEKMNLRQELKLPMEIRDYTQGETFSFKHENGMPCIAWRSKVGIIEGSTGGLSCNWYWEEE